MELDLAVVAGAISSVVFVGSVLPMLIKAVRTRDLASYSMGNLVLANLGNVVHSVYVFSLPMGPIWALHSFYLITSGFMLAMYLCHRKPLHREDSDHDIPSGTIRDNVFPAHRLGGLTIRDTGRTEAGRPDDELEPVGVL